MSWSKIWNTFQSFSIWLIFGWVLVKKPLLMIQILCYWNYLYFYGFSSKAHSKIIWLWGNGYVFHILDQDTTFLFYKSFGYITAKKAFLSITHKGLLQIFSKSYFSTTHPLALHSVVVPSFAHFKNVDAGSDSLWFRSASTAFCYNNSLEK